MASINQYQHSSIATQLLGTVRTIINLVLFSIRVDLDQIFAV